LSYIIRTEGLARWYGEVVGLSDLTVKIEPGITGLVGPNGAGKSTFMKCIVGEIRPHRGRIEVLGLSPFANQALYRRLGFCPQQDALYDHMSGREFVEHLLRLSGTPRRSARAKAVRSMERVGLADTMERRCTGYSKGMRQRVRLAQAIAHEPELLVVDEPLTGLDPLVRKRMVDLFLELRNEGKSILVSSHVLHEVEALTERIVLIHRGRLLAQGKLAEIRDLLSTQPRRVKLPAASPRALAERIISLPGVNSVQIDQEETGVEVTTRDLPGLNEALPSIVKELRPGVTAFESHDEDLEAVFDYLVG
jgi:ABC-2 type transport system ATP-binding protein